MEIKAKEQDREELILFQTICMHCPECHFPISASQMGEVGLRLRLRKATPLSAFLSPTSSVWQQVITVGWGNLVTRAAAAICTAQSRANCELLRARSELTSGALPCWLLMA